MKRLLGKTLRGACYGQASTIKAMS